LSQYLLVNRNRFVLPTVVRRGYCVLVTDLALARQTFTGEPGWKI
jgi:hypothetical protein